MEGNEIMEYKNGPLEECNVIVEKSKRRKHSSGLKRFFCLVLIVGIFAVIIYNYPHIRAYFSSFPSENDVPINTDSIVSSQEGENNLITDNEPPREELIPNGAHSISVSLENEYMLINESECEIDFSSEGIFVKSNEIYEKYGNEAPVVLIIHSSNRESYSNGNYYKTDDSFYSDTSNVGEIGEIITKALNSLGINTIHINETYASGAIHSSSKEYRQALESALSTYPSISYVFDISRDVCINNDLSMEKQLTLCENSSVSSIKITSGTSCDTINENQLRSILFSSSFSSFCNEKYSGYVSENVISRYELSQNYAPVCLRVDIGTYANSFEEASLSAEAFALLFSQYIKS